MPTAHAGIKLPEHFAIILVEKFIDIVLHRWNKAYQNV